MINCDMKAEKRIDLWYVLSLILLSCSCLNLVGKGSLIFLLFCLLSLVFTYKKGQKIPYYFILYFFCAVAVVLSSLLFYSYAEVIKCVNYLLPFIIGFNLIINSKDYKQTIIQIFFAVFLGFSLNIIIVYFYNLGIKRESVRTLYSFWTKEPIAVTCVGLFSSVVIGYAAYAIIGRARWIIKILSITSLVFGLILAIDTATRTPLVLSILVFVIMNYIYIKSNRGRAALRFIFILGLFFLFIYMAYSFDLLGIKTFFESSNIFKRLEDEGLETSRWEISLEHFRLMPKYLWGGGNITNETSEFAHNVLQDAYDNFGVLFAFPFLFIIIHWVYNLIKISCIKGKTSVDYLLVSVQLAIMIQFCVEPVVTGYPVILWCMFLFDGISTAYLIIRGNVIENCVY